ncbi:MAG: ureidoglycolate lyase [Gammaproteobacteria bacterium]|nr:ureidoglycolate lyase [Gammaproteobacteria bacterium]NNF60415.1 ureidoglycolate lyase [Gammaproteobacteria bacterium]NNM20657.1 ureidoglycolate lyase [Gammaproteobacteria bacterium]
MNLTPQPLTREAFEPFGQVIETDSTSPMNDGRFARSLAQATLDLAPPGQARIDVVTCQETTPLPYEIGVLERHPLGSQAFVPLTGFSFVVVVAAGEQPGEPRAFVTNGRQGIVYRRGTWHMPMIATAGQQFLLIERHGEEANCEEHRLAEVLTLVGPA